MLHLAAGDSSSNLASGVILWIVLIAAYWVPTVIAGVRHVHGLGQVVVVNLFLGWTVIGWIIALVMSFRHVPEAPAVTR